MRLSIVTTLYQSSPYIDEFYNRAVTAARSMTDDYEMVLVNDGSPDDSLAQAMRLVELDSHVVLIDLSRNFGHHKAMMTGLSYAKGERIFLIDSDLEEEPEWLLSFSRQMEQDQCDVVYGIQEQRKGDWFERWSGRWFYTFFRAMTGMNLPDNIVTARLMTRRYVDALLRHDEREVFLAGLWHITGFDQKPQFIRKHKISETTYTVRRKMSVLLNSVTSFSSIPLVIIFFSGCSIFLVSCLFAAYLLLNWLVLSKPPSGYTSLMVSIWLLAGMISAFLGVVGIYISKIYSEVKKRPYTIVRDIFRKDAAREGISWKE